MKKLGKKYALGCLILILSVYWNVTASATQLAPTNYVATPGEGIAQGGGYNYFDDTGHQLTDGILGANLWSANLGNGVAYEWVAWRIANPVITFQFAQSVTIDQVSIDFNRDSYDLIGLPSTVKVNNTTFSVSPTAIPDTSRGTLAFNGSWTGSTLTITLTDNNPSQWIFVDEMWADSPQVPEPSVWALSALSLVAMTWLWIRRPVPQLQRRRIRR